MTLSSTTMTKIQTHQNFKTTDEHRHEKYCAMVEGLSKGCLKKNFLELWESNQMRIQSLTKDAIVAKLNRSEVSHKTRHKAEFVSLLGGIETNSTGFTVWAKSVLASRMLHLNFSFADSSKFGNNAGTEDWATYDTMVFESKFPEVMNRLQLKLETDDIKILLWRHEKLRR